MSDLTSSEKRKLERLFEMGSGYALNFSHRTLGEFIDEHTGRDVYAQDYPQRGSGSKAWKIRTFWEVEPNHLCGKLIAALIDHRAEILEEQQRQGGTILDVTRQPDEERLVEECRRIASRLSHGGPVAEISAIAAPVPERDFCGSVGAPPESKPRLGPWPMPSKVPIWGFPVTPRASGRWPQHEAEPPRSPTTTSAAPQSSCGHTSALPCWSAGAQASGR